MNKILITMNKTESILDNKINFITDNLKYVNAVYPFDNDPFDYKTFIINNGVVRRYPKNYILSKNYNTLKILNDGCQFVCVNAQNDDGCYNQYINYFTNAFQGYMM